MWQSFWGTLVHVQDAANACIMDVHALQELPATIRPSSTVVKSIWQQATMQTSAVQEIANSILAEQTPKQLFAVRGKMYELLVNCIPPELIFKKLMLELVSKLDDELKHKVADCAAFFEHRLQARLSVTCDKEMTSCTLIDIQLCAFQAVLFNEGSQYDPRLRTLFHFLSCVSCHAHVSTIHCSFNHCKRGSINPCADNLMSRRKVKNPFFTWRPLLPGS